MVATKGQGRHSSACERRTSPEVEDLELRLAVAEDYADLVTVNVVTGGEREMEETPVVTEDGYDAGLLYGGSVEVQADETVELSERLKVLRFEQVTVSEAEVCEGRVGSCQ